MNSKMKKIGLITCASNFEHHKKMIYAVHAKLKAMGGYILYVITNYGVYGSDEKMDFSHGEPAVYSLLDQIELDGCILESNLGNIWLVDLIKKKLHHRNIPLVTVNLKNDTDISLNVEIQSACREMIGHLIEKHGCRRINLAVNGNYFVSNETVAVYREALEKNGITYDERRVATKRVSLQSGRDFYHIFEERGVMSDSQAVICAHDVCAIGLCLELKKYGYKVPEDILICSMNHSHNSIIFRPAITGVDKLDEVAADRACELLKDLMENKPVAQKNYYSGKTVYAASCGCRNDSMGNNDAEDQIFHQLTVNKIEAGGQISSMMNFNNSLEDVDSLRQLAEKIKNMLCGIYCGNFFCCLNQNDLEYIQSDYEDVKDEASAPYDQNMVVVTGMSDRTGEMSDHAFGLKELVPVEAKEGDLFLVLPIHVNSRDYGYMVFLNDYFPVDVYNYRICHESIGSSIENLHRQMILRSSIAKLDDLHMKDQLTGLYNRFAFKRYQVKYIEKGIFAVVMLDMDGLKIINDQFGHQEGNKVIRLIAEMIRGAVDEEDLVMRYGGDEFVVLSHNVDTDYWEKIKRVLNEKLQGYVLENDLPYKLGISVGYAVSLKEAPKSMAECLESADQAMYENKKARKQQRK